MRRRSGASGKLQGRKRPTPKRRDASNRGASIAGQETIVARLTHERDEALLRETANSEILRLISKAPGDLELVFRTILEDATRICDAKFGTLFRFDGKMFNFAADVGSTPEFAEFESRRGPFQPTPGSHLERVMRTKRVSHTADYAAEGVASPPVTLGRARSTVDVPMLKDNELIGVLSIYRQEVRPFTDKQIELLQNFAAQAVIAIENARLLNELHQSLEQQTATADVLRIISSSPGELAPVFQAMLENATRICEAKFGMLFRLEDGAMLPVASLGVPEPLMEFFKHGPHRPSEHAPIMRVARTKQPVHVLDFGTERAYLEGSPVAVAGVELGGVRTNLVVPLLKENELIGAFAIYRQEVRPFTDKQIELARNFAAQAVIAIENTRLLNELKQSLEQQTATADVLRVISASPGDLEPVFEAMLDKAMQLCEASFGGMWTLEADRYTAVALRGVPRPYAAFLNETTVVPGPGTAPYRLLHGERFVHNVDLASEEAYRAGDPQRRALVDLGGARTALQVPLCKDESIVGVITIYRQEVRPFTDKQIELVQNFAAQAVIAIENARLLNELRQRTADLTQSLEQQTATADVLRVISSSPGDLAPVFQSMLEAATRLCEAQFGFLFRYDGRLFNNLAVRNAPAALLEFMEQRGAFLPPAGTVLHDLLVTRDVVHRADASAAQMQSAPVRLAGAKSFLAVPMFKNETLVGAISIFRQEVRPFTDKQIELLQNFAAQAVIAIENARLLNDLNELNQQLEQRVTDQVGEIERMGRLRRFLPPQVADLIVASGSEKQLESHRREITALFCDLRGFTGFSESSDPEDVMALLRDYHAAIGEIIIKYSGTLERYAGDGVMVVFNDPVPVENPALQAVLMALEMRTTIGALIEKWRDLGHDLGFGIGIAHGFATLGTIGFEGRFDYAAIGTVSNVASRLCDEAKPGQILISPRVRQALEKAVTVEAVGEFALKGIRRPMAAYNVLALSTSKPN